MTFLWTRKGLTMRWSERRTAVRSTFCDDFHTSTPSDARPRPPSLILFSLGACDSSRFTSFWRASAHGIRSLLALFRRARREEYLLPFPDRHSVLGGISPFVFALPAARSHLLPLHTTDAPGDQPSSGRVGWRVGHVFRQRFSCAFADLYLVGICLVVVFPISFAFAIRRTQQIGGQRLTKRWSERPTAVRSTFAMTSTLSLRTTRGPVRRRSSCSR